MTAPSGRRWIDPANPRLWLVTGAVIVLFLVWASGLGGYLTLDTLRLHRQTLTGLVAAQPLIAALGYTAIYVAVVALSLPGGLVLTLTGGFLFGAVGGTILTVIAATIGACLAFAFAKAVLGEDGLSRLGDRAATLSEAIRRNASSYLLVLRLVPLFPFVLVNLVPAFAGVPFRTFVWTTLVGILPGTAVFTLGGAGLGRILDEGGSISAGQLLTPEIIAGLVGLALLSLLAIPLKSWLARHRPTG